MSTQSMLSAAFRAALLCWVVFSFSSVVTAQMPFRVRPSALRTLPAETPDEREQEQSAAQAQLDLADNDRSGLAFPAEARPFGQSHAQWSADWWQWVYSIPAAVNPLLDQTGRHCAVGQRGNVWFLGGVFNETGTATRSCTIPADVGVFFPILNVAADNIGVVPPASVRELRQAAKELMDGAETLTAELNGRLVTDDGWDYRFRSPVFSIALPPDNLQEVVFGIPEAVPGVYSPVVADGYYLMLRPLPVGNHVLRIRSRVGAFSLDVTYNLKVVGVAR